MSTGIFELLAGSSSPLLAATDVVCFVDVSDPTQAPQGSLVKGTMTAFFAAIPVPVVVTSASANALAVGLTGATNPALQVDASTALQVAGLKVTGAVTGGTVAVQAIDSGAATNLSLNAKGTGTIAIGSASTGRVTITPVTTISGALTLSAALTYGGVTLSNAVTGTGNMVLSASPTFTGTAAFASTSTTSRVGIGAAPASTVGLFVSGSLSTGGTQHSGINAGMTFSETVTDARALLSSPATAASAITITNAVGLFVQTWSKGAGSTITNQYGVYINSMTTGSANWAIYTNNGTVHFSDLLELQQGNANTAVIAASGLSLTGSDATTGYSLAGTWNTSGTPTALKVAITNTASNASSRILDLLGGASGTTSLCAVTAAGQLMVTSLAASDRAAAITAGGTVTATGYAAILANTQTSSTGSINKFGLYIDVSGTWNGAGSKQAALYNANAGPSMVMAGGALATGATTGFTYMPTCAGTPTGVPDAWTGTVAFVYDTTNNIIYLYNGAWKKTAALT